MSEQQNIQKIQAYQRLATYYDQLMDYIDYDIWIEDIEALVAPFDPGKNCLDISCGTGSMALRLAKRGWKMTAVDLSPHMIEIARVKQKQEQVKLIFEVGDMTTYQSTQAYNVIINLHDGLNYLLETTDIQSFMDNTYSLLSPGGVLLFDVATPLLCQTHFRGYREIYNDEQGGYERYTTYDPDSQLVESVFTLNTSDEDTVEVETHIQRAYELSDVEAFCRDSKYNWWQILDDETLEKGGEDAERYLVLMRKPV